MKIIRSQTDALAEARRRWGKAAGVRKSKCWLLDHMMWERRIVFHGPQRPICSCSAHGRPCPGDRPTYAVGFIALGIMFSIEGEGSSWSAAFAAADKREGES